MNFIQISPFIRVAQDSTIHSPWQLPSRVIFDYEILYVKEGEISVRAGNNKYAGKPGDLFLFKPKEPHSISIMGRTPLRQPHIHFDLFERDDSRDVRVSYAPLSRITSEEMKYFRNDITSGPDNLIPNKITPRFPHIIEDMIFDIIKEKASRSPYSHMLTKGLFIQLWVYFLREVYWNENPGTYANRGKGLEIKEFIDDSINRDITLDELSQFANLSKYHLARVFKEIFGISPIQYHQELRIHRAKQMILDTSESLTEIARELGFGSISSFSRCFKQNDGFYPSYYRK